MDSTRVITTSSKHSTCLPSPQKSRSSSSIHCNYDNGVGKNTGGMFTIGNGNGGQILMNSHDINKATRLQFSPPIRSKTTATTTTTTSNGYSGNPNSLATDYRGGIYTGTTTTTTTTSIVCRPPACQNIGKGVIVDTMATKKLLSAVIRQQQNNCSTFMSTTFMAKFPSKNALEMIADDKALFIETHSTNANYYQTMSTSPSPPSPIHDDNGHIGHIGNLKGGLNSSNLNASNDGNKLINSIKSFFSAIIKPIIDTTSLIVGNDTKTELNRNDIGQNANHKPTLQDFVRGDCCNYEISNSNNMKLYGTQMLHHHHHHHDHHHAPTDMMLDNVPFFDCDDFIDGGEDTIDFVADSTKFEWQQPNHHQNARNFDDLMLDKVKARSLSKENIFYDCMPATGMDTPIQRQQQQQQKEQQQLQQHASDVTAIESIIDKSLAINESVWEPMIVSTDNDNKTIETVATAAAAAAASAAADCDSLEMKIQIDDNLKINDNVQYENDDSNKLWPEPTTTTTTTTRTATTTKTIITPKLDAAIPKRHSYRRRKHKKHNKRNTNKRTNNRSNFCHKNTASNKNRHEKSRHEIEMNIHDDIDEIFSNDLPHLPSSSMSSFHQNHNTEATEIDDDGDDDDDDADIGLEIVDVAADRPTTSSALNIQANPSNLSNSSNESDISTLSPETISNGCIFTKFFRFDANKCPNKPKSLPYRLAQKLVPQMPSMQTERNLSSNRTSETESDGFFIVFDEQNSTIALRRCYSRQRQISECSDDFILFVRDDDPDSDSSHDSDDTDEDDFTDSTDDDSADETDDNDLESDNESDCLRLFEEKQRDDSNQPDSGFEEKKVSFNLRPKVHEIRAWKFAYSAARKGEWEQIYRDRKRFENRINDLNRIIAPVLAAEHRQQIFNERFKELQRSQSK